MKDVLTDILRKLSDGVYKNEEHVRLSLVSRLLHELGWDLWNPNEVNSEFPVIPQEDQTRVDLALFLTPYAPPSLFIEIKAVGKLEGNINQIEQQLRDYNRNNTALFSIITDGRKWRFYYSQTGGEFSQKCFKNLDILDDDFDDVESCFYTFLSKSEIGNGNAKVEAQNYLQMNQKQRAMEDAMSEARRMILEPPYPSLPQAIVEIVSRMEFRITLDEATNFIKQSEGKRVQKPLVPPPKPMQPPKPETPVEYKRGKLYSLEELLDLQLRGSSPGIFSIADKEYTVKNWSDLSVKFVSWLIEEGILIQSKVPILAYSYRDKYFINVNPNHKNPNRDGSWERVSDYYIDVKYNAENHIKNLKATFEQIGIQDPGIKISLL